MMQYYLLSLSAKNILQEKNITSIIKICIADAKTDMAI
jgi:hypothetical protein